MPKEECNAGHPTLKAEVIAEDANESASAPSSKINTKVGNTKFKDLEYVRNP
jgi:hypothetical protein